MAGIRSSVYGRGDAAAEGVAAVTLVLAGHARRLEVGRAFGVPRRTLHRWIAAYTGRGAKALTSIKEDFRFIVYTKSPELVSPYRTTLGTRLDLRDYIPREDLIHALGRMDFLVNFDNNRESAVPSKLIDYAIAGRPVLNVREPWDASALVRFLGGDYSRAMRTQDLDGYRIENVCDQFLSLLKSS